MDKKAIFKPFPAWMWGAGFLGLSVPLFVAHKAGDLPLIPYYIGDEFVRYVEDKEQLEKYQDILQKVGVKHPEKVQFVETKSVGPMALGSNGSHGAYIFIPQLLSRINNPNEHFSLTTVNDITHEPEILFDGSARELTDDVRSTILHNTGTLLPTSAEMEYIIGHEGVHIAHDHSSLSSVCVAASFLSSHLLIKGYNYAARRYSIPFAPSMNPSLLRGYLPYLLLTTSFSAISLTWASWRMEMAADIHSVRQLNCYDAALSLIDKKIEQNKITNARFPSLFVTKSGNDFSSLEHPPLTLQRKYISSLSH